MPRPCFTLTGNLLWERTLVFAGWAPGRTQRAESESFQVGGKGINVAKMLRRLGVASTALCFAGGPAGAACLGWLREHGVDFQAFPSAATTREGLVVRGGNQPETTFLGPDAPPGPAGVRACAAFLDQVPDGSLLAICGSLPGWSGPDFDPLRTALERWLGRGTLAVDTYGPPLAWFVQRPVDLIKINRTEFDGLQAGSDLAALRGRFPVRSWVITDGPGPVRLLDEAGAGSELTPPPIREVSATGSGDVLLACLLEAHGLRGLPLADAVAWALPYAAANAADPGVADFALPVAKGSF